MGKKSRNKGYRGEHGLVTLLRESGLSAKRIPLSGATEFARGDIIVGGLTAEVKLRKNGFKELYKWIRDRDLLFVKADREPYLCVMRVELLITLLGGRGDDGEKDSKR